MRTIFLLVIFTVVLNSIVAQNISTSEKERMIAELDSVDLWARRGAIEEIKTYKVTEAIPKLIDNIWDQKSPGMAYDFLECLYQLNYPEIRNLTYAFIDSLNRYDYNRFSTYAPQELKIMAIDILFKTDDYSQAEELFSFIESNPDYAELSCTLSMLGDLLAKVPQYSERAKAELLKVAFNKGNDDSSNYNSRYALFRLQKALGADIISEVEQIFQDASRDFGLRIYCMNILSKEHRNNLVSIYKAQLVADTNKVFKATLTREMLKEIGTPDIIAFLDSLSANEANDWMKKIILYQIQDFVPKADSTQTIQIMIDSLISFTTQSYTYNWIADGNYKDYLMLKLHSAQNYLASSDSQNCARQIKWYQFSVQQVYSDSAGSYPKYVSKDAYKFLYYYPQYILERLPEVTEPRNDLIAKASAEITTVNGVLQYSYTITNEAASNQSAANIYVEDTTTSTLSAPINWQTEKVHNKLDRFYTAANPITAGTTQSGYLVTSNSLPVIGKMYVQSERFAVDTTDIKTNSYEVTTVVPLARPSQINASAFIDSIISYNNRAYSLGWMQYYWVRDNNYYQLNNAKTMINMNVPASAVVILTAFEGWLDTCMSQSYFNKETYGLLKYNSIYLREKLSGQ